jgi:hypothetical protein
MTENKEMTQGQIAFLFGAIEKLEPRPGDILKVKCKERLTAAQVASLRQITGHLLDFNPGIKVVILDQDTDIELEKGAGI